MIGCILLAAGKGSRFGDKKQFLELGGKRILDYSIETVESLPQIDKVVVVLPQDSIDLKIKMSKDFEKVVGGSERQYSVYNGLLHLKNCDIVVIHDTARPFATSKMFLDGIENVKSGWDGSITAYKSRDTVKEVLNKKVVKTLDRESIYIVQTPQTFDYQKLLYAHKKALSENFLATDDSALMEREGFKITVNEGNFLNFKITYPEDLELAKALLKR
ncbi:2-C-methyl-D-erythritol 4-phosphate cytidylyltransferase [Sulfurihydrogenibium azorense]|uniref:2-C-methyl-D-erythritol 4-phosphate cytidylyltransferase n=1 Tax=Sulfurihydrogenibium azorense TaxID=309806 RepID=UPI002409C748|nr:2-C-methyl-D-erythritol 4-phosphate cytidylyltransferase [Sulfurihydrogenibium azorense]MDM7273981.1 2-C-methyl-D-erythritol 4-phosphate cytidylyltransferase [Sulfurihydrogenibium azorense]